MECIKRKHVAELLEGALKLPALIENEAAYIDMPKKHAYYTPILKLAKVLDFAFDFNMTVYDAFEDVNRGD